MIRLTLRLALALIFIFAAAAPNALAFSAEDEMRARELGRTLRCVICQNQSIEDSDAPLAADMRALVRARIAAGDSDAEIKDRLRATYGDFVLLRPPVQANTIILWAGPAVILIVIAALALRRRRPVADETTPLSPEESAALAKILDGAS